MIHKIKGLQLQNIKKAPIGFSGDSVFIVDKGYREKDVVVKFSAREEVYQEGKNLQWLADKTKVPQVYEIGKVEGQYYVLMEKVKGKMLQEAFTYLPVEEVIVLYAKAIREFHTITIKGLPYNHSLAQKIKDVERNIATGKLTTQYFEREFQKMTIEEVYQLLISYQQTEEDLVLCHGDVCMPNMIIDNDNNIHYIDVVQLGVCDRYLDIAIGLRSLRYNLEYYGYTLKQEHLDLFKRTYGIKKWNRDKIMFYILIDELTIG